jgi:hypothetical protein
MPGAEYWAGFFDGEGSVHISKRGGIRASMSQKRSDILYLAEKDFGGTVSVRDRGEGDFHGQWNTTSADGVKIFLNAIKEYSVVKREEIDIALECADMIRTENLGCNPISQDDFDKRMDLRVRLFAIRNPRYADNVLAKRLLYRRSIKEMCGNRCRGCGTNLEPISTKDQIIKDGKLYCRSCHMKTVDHTHKRVSAEEIEVAIKNSSTLNEAASKLGINRSSLYKKRRKDGVLSFPCRLCGKTFFLNGDRHKKYCSDDCALNASAKAYDNRAKSGEFKEKKKVNDRLYQERHKEEVAKKQREYYEANKERIKAYSREWHRRRKELNTPTVS